MQDLFHEGMKEDLKMKKIISLVLMVAMLISISAFAEDEFTLHNGTKFGMTVEEVINQEMMNGYTVVKSEDFDGLYGEGIIAGRSPSALRFFFDDEAERGMVQCNYVFFTTSETNFNNMNDQLIKKYGEPTYTAENDTFCPVPIKYQPYRYGLYAASCPYTYRSLTENTFSTSDGSFQYYFAYECPLYSQWLIPQTDGGAILIDHSAVVEYKQGYYDNERNRNLDMTTAYETITYSLLSKEQVDLIEMNANKISDDL